MPERDHLDVGPIHLTWEPASRIVLMSFAPATRVTGTHANATVDQMLRWSGDSAFDLIVDCSNLEDTDSSWRSAFAAFVKPRRDRVRFAWFEMSPMVTMMAEMFVRALRVKGRGFPHEADARAWLAKPGE